MSVLGSLIRPVDSVRDLGVKIIQCEPIQFYECADDRKFDPVLVTKIRQSKRRMGAKLLPRKLLNNKHQPGQHSDSYRSQVGHRGRSKRTGPNFSVDEVHLRVLWLQEEIQEPMNREFSGTPKRIQQSPNHQLKQLMPIQVQ